jgi:O-antigen ligase
MMIVLAGGLFLLALLTWFYLLEIEGRRHTIFIVLAVVFLVEAIIAGGGASVPVGILRPRFGGQDFRPHDLVIVAAVGAHMLAGRIGRLGPLTFGWAPFAAVYACGVAVGLLYNQPTDQILFEGKTLFYLLGGALVASGADLVRLMDAIGRIGIVLAPIVPLALFLRTAGIDLAISTPVQQLPELGAVSNDTITILVALGAVLIIAESVRANPSYVRLGAGFVLLLAPVAGEQRGSYLSLAGSLLALIFIVGGRTWRERATLRPAHLGLVTAVLTAVLLVGYLATDSSGVVISSVEDAFGGVGNEQSARARTSLYDQAISQISENPIFGTGVGTQVTTTVESGELTTAAHNIVLELLLRVGMIGLATFVIAVAVTWAVSVRVWRWAPQPPIAAVGASVIIVFASVLSKAMVEPALSKYRLALILGMALGCLATAERTVPAGSERRSTATVGQVRQQVAESVERSASSADGGIR